MADSFNRECKRKVDDDLSTFLFLLFSVMLIMKI